MEYTQKQLDYVLSKRFELLESKGVKLQTNTRIFKALANAIVSIFEWNLSQFETNSNSDRTDALNHVVNFLLMAELENMTANPHLNDGSTNKPTNFTMATKGKAFVFALTNYNPPPPLTDRDESHLDYEEIPANFLGLYELDSELLINFVQELAKRMNVPDKHYNNIAFLKEVSENIRLYTLTGQTVLKRTV